ncbi:MAG: MMPL family transporter [Actinomycetota bacterium]|nr:MMPL family transporter [Actinomycetota bacterium]
MLQRVGRASYHHRRLVLVAWLAALVAAIVAANLAGDSSPAEFTTPGAESTEARTLLEERFPARAGDTVEVVVSAPGRVTEADVRADVEALLARASEVSHVVGVRSPYDPANARQVSPDGTVAVATLQLDVASQDMPTEATRELLDLTDGADRDGLTFELSGFAISNAEDSEAAPEGIGLLVAAVILLVTFGSVLAMGLPLLTALLGLGIAGGLTALVANLVPTPEFAAAVASMIGLGVGIDYVLLIVTRYRSGLAGGLDPEEATIVAIDTAGRSALFAGCTVIISLLGLLVIGLDFLQGVALAAASAVAVVMVASVTLLPALLGFVGRTVDRLRVPFIGRRPGPGDGLWSRWSRVVQRRPLAGLVVGLAVLAALIVPLGTMRFGFPDAGNEPPTSTVRRAYDLLTTGFGPGANGPLLVAVDTEQSADGDASLARLGDALSAAPGVAAVSPAATSPVGDAALLVITPTTGPQDEDTVGLIHDLRDEVVPEATAGTGLRALVGGPTAATIDANDYVAERLPWFIGIVVALSFVLLMAVFRSVLVPLKAAVMNVLSIAAAYGVVALATQGGWLGGLLGIEEAVPVPSFIPMMMFAVLFGLSMDYEVFLLSRIREEYLRTGDNTQAVADGLAKTARVITAAAAIMVSVFLAFVMSDEIFLKLIGLGLATAIAVDATIVRLLLVPSTMELLGRANWWWPLRTGQDAGASGPHFPAQNEERDKVRV